MPSITQTKKEYKTPITSEFTKSLSKIFFSADLIAKQMETSVTNINSIGELIEIRPQSSKKPAKLLDLHRLRQQTHKTSLGSHKQFRYTH